MKKAEPLAEIVARVVHPDRDGLVTATDTHGTTRTGHLGAWWAELTQRPSEMPRAKAWNIAAGVYAAVALTVVVVLGRLLEALAFVSLATALTLVAITASRYLPARDESAACRRYLTRRTRRVAGRAPRGAQVHAIGAAAVTASTERTRQAA